MNTFKEIIKKFLLEHGEYDWVGYLAKELGKSPERVYVYVQGANNGIGNVRGKISYRAKDGIIAACDKISKRNPVRKYFRELEAK